MNKLIKLKKYFTIQEAADYLSKASDEDIKASDIYNFALEGSLKISVDPIGSAFLRPAVLIPTHLGTSVIKENAEKTLDLFQELLIILELNNQPNHEKNIKNLKKHIEEIKELIIQKKLSILRELLINLESKDYYNENKRKIFHHNHIAYIAELIKEEDNQETLDLLQRLLAILQSNDCENYNRSIKHLKLYISNIESCIKKHNFEKSLSHWLYLPRIFDNIPKDSLLLRWFNAKYILLNGYSFSDDKQLIFGDIELNNEGLYDLLLKGNGWNEVRKLELTNLSEHASEKFSSEGLFIKSTDSNGEVKDPSLIASLILSDSMPYYACMLRYFLSEMLTRTKALTKAEAEAQLTAAAESAAKSTIGPGTTKTDFPDLRDLTIIYQPFEYRDKKELEIYNIPLDAEILEKNYLQDSSLTNKKLVITANELARFINSQSEEILENEKSLSTKTKNKYLETIKALGNLATKGLTGSHNKDAGAIVAALNLVGLDPIEQKTLAKYLKEAPEIKKLN